eukprot:6672243-Prymnesium_polylepis.1
MLSPKGGWREAGDVIVSGHSHSPRLERHPSGVTFLNPGSAGPQRFKLPRRCALVHCGIDGGFSVSAVDLTAGASTSAWAVAGAMDACGGGHAAGTKRPAAEGAAAGPLDDDEQPPPRTMRRARAPTPSMQLAAGGPSRFVGIVGALHRKEAHGVPMRRVDALELEARRGARGDVHASALSPRQLLVHSSAAAGGVEPGGFHENILLSADDGAPDRANEADGGDGACWPPPSGAVLEFGEGGATLRVTFACEPCAKGAALAGVPLDALSTGWKARASRGVLGTALSSGVVRVGDEVRLTAATYEPLQQEHPARVRHVLAKVPPGRVVTCAPRRPVFRTSLLKLTARSHTHTQNTHTQNTHARTERATARAPVPAQPFPAAPNDLRSLSTLPPVRMRTSPSHRCAARGARRRSDRLLHAWYAGPAEEGAGARRARAPRRRLALGHHPAAQRRACASATTRDGCSTRGPSRGHPPTTSSTCASRRSDVAKGSLRWRLGGARAVRDGLRVRSVGAPKTVQYTRAPRRTAQRRTAQHRTGEADRRTGRARPALTAVAGAGRTPHPRRHCATRSQMSKVLFTTYKPPYASGATTHGIEHVAENEPGRVTWSWTRAQPG